MPLSKSDFILACSCPKKLVYKKQGYPTGNDTNEYLQMLAQGGYIVGKYAQLMYPQGIEIEAPTNQEAVEKTNQLLASHDNIVLFEAAFSSNNKIVRTDILVKEGSHVHLIEVKSKSFDSQIEFRRQRTDLMPYIEDLAYQTYVVSEALPEYAISSSLYLPDKSKRTTIEGLAGWFKVELQDTNNEIEELRGQQIPRFKKPTVNYLHEHSDDAADKLKSLIDDNLLVLVNCDTVINELMSGIRQKATVFIDILNNGIKDDQYAPSKLCKACEYKLTVQHDQHGYKECWKELADVDPHIFDLYHGGSIGHKSNGFYLDELIREKKVRFSDINPEKFTKSNGEIGSRGERQLLQYQNTISNKEFFHPDLRGLLENLKYPLHFIDFETYISVIPHHSGMRPYEKISFQWSCHTIPSPGAEIQHAEYINDDYSFPCFRFAETLMQHIGDSGTPLMWSPFENTTLNEILYQMDSHNYSNDRLKDWLISITKDDHRPGRFVDMADYTLKYYFHPLMKGSYSIKKVLPAIWSTNPWLHSDPWFADYAPGYEAKLDPYDTLVKQMTDLEEDEIVMDGTGAMRAYHDMMYGPSSKDPHKRGYLKQSLLNYCKLDTLAMVIIWKYWMSKK